MGFTEKRDGLMPFAKHESEFIAQLPGLAVWKNDKSEYLLCNLQGAKQLGFKNANETIGIRDDQIQCPAAECAEVFIEKDKEILVGSDVEIETLDINTWANGRRLVSYSKKKTFHYSDNGVKKSGIVFYSMEVTGNMLQKLAYSLNSNFFGERIKSNSICYEIKKDFSDLNITERESHCLFLLARGYTTKAIGKFLGISHKTAEGHIEKIKAKLNFTTKNELVDFAHASGFIVTIPRSMLVALTNSGLFE